MKKKKTIKKNNYSIINSLLKEIFNEINKINKKKELVALDVENSKIKLVLL